MHKDMTARAVKVANSQLRHHNSLLRKNLRMVISCSADNEKSQDNIDGMEELIFASTSIKTMFDTLLTEGRRIFNMDVITVCLDPSFREHYPEEYKSNGNSVFLESDNITFTKLGKFVPLFGGLGEPVIRGGLKSGAGEFFPNGLSRKIRSEALMPLRCGNRLAGMVGFGSSNGTRFHEGQGPRFLKRLSRSLSMKMELFEALAANGTKIDA